MKLVSIVFSFRNEEKNLNELISRVDATFKKVEKARELGVKILSQNEWYKLLN